MKRSALALIVCAAFLLPLGCEDSSPTEPGTNPAWLQALIAQIQSEPVTSPPSAIYSYRYRGEMVTFGRAAAATSGAFSMTEMAPFSASPTEGLTAEAMADVPTSCIRAPRRS